MKVDVKKVDAAVKAVRQLVAGKASLAGVCAAVKGCTAEELELISLGSRVSVARLEVLKQMDQLVT